MTRRYKLTQTEPPPRPPARKSPPAPFGQAKGGRFMDAEKKFKPRSARCLEFKALA